MGPVIRSARDRLKALLESLKEDHIVAAGMIGDPDPFIAIMNACQYFRVSEVIISTLPRDRRSGWPTSSSSASTTRSTPGWSTSSRRP